MTPGAKALTAWLIIGAVWDIITKPDQTLSAAAARGLLDKRTRYPMAAALILVAVHLVVMARSFATPQPPVDTTPFEVLRNLSWPA